MGNVPYSREFNASSISLINCSQPQKSFLQAWFSPQKLTVKHHLMKTTYCCLSSVCPVTLWLEQFSCRSFHHQHFKSCSYLFRWFFFFPQKNKCFSPRRHKILEKNKLIMRCGLIRGLGWEKSFKRDVRVKYKPNIGSSKFYLSKVRVLCILRVFLRFVQGFALISSVHYGRYSGGWKGKE